MGNYLYNGVEFPALPEQDKPYAYIIDNTGATIHAFIYFTDKPLYCTASDGNFHIPANTTVHCYKKYDYNDFWEHSFEKNFATDTDMGSSDALLWASVDVVDDTGAVVLAASDPVPASPVQLNPAALMQGFATMLSLRK